MSGRFGLTWAFRRIMKVKGERDALQHELDEMTAYADKLADGLPEGMLPKDIENLRNANVGLAEELSTLRQSLRDAKEEIESALSVWKDKEKPYAKGITEGYLTALDFINDMLED